MSLRARFTVFVLLYCFITGIVVGFVLYLIAQGQLHKNGKKQVRVLARAVAGALDGDAHSGMAYTRSLGDPRYIRSLEYLQKVKASFPAEFSMNIFTIHYDPEASFWRYVLDDMVMAYDVLWVKTEDFAFDVHTDADGQLRAAHGFKTNTARFSLTVNKKKVSLHFEGDAPRQSLSLEGRKLLEVRRHAPFLVFDTVFGEMGRERRESMGEFEIAGKRVPLSLAFCAQGEPQSLPGERFKAPAEFLRRCADLLAKNEDAIVDDVESIWGDAYFTAIAPICSSDGAPRDLACIDVFIPARVFLNEELLDSMASAVIPLLLVILSLSLVHGQRLIQPVLKLDAAMRQIAFGDFSVRVDLGNIREYACLAEHFNLMTARHAEYVDESRRNAALAREMEIARAIQDSLIPKNIPASPFYEIACRYSPQDAIGGDSFCFRSLSENRVGVLVSDVAGHGVSAALISNMVHMAFEFEFRRAFRAGDLLAGLNRALYPKCAEDKFVTACYAHFDFGRRRFYAANAGHPPMILYRRSEDRFAFIKPKGVPIACFEDARYESVVCDLQPGDRIIFYTDGISDAHWGEGRLFGASRFLEIVRESTRISASGFADRILSEARAWRSAAEEPREDDMTIVVVDVA